MVTFINLQFRVIGTRRKTDLGQTERLINNQLVISRSVFVFSWLQCLSKEVWLTLLVYFNKHFSHNKVKNWWVTMSRTIVYSWINVCCKSFYINILRGVAIRLQSCWLVHLLLFTWKFLTLLNDVEMEQTEDKFFYGRTLLHNRCKK